MVQEQAILIGTLEDAITEANELCYTQLPR